MPFEPITIPDIIRDRIQTATSTSVSGYLGGIDKSDIPYMYHHLKKGCILNLHSINSNDRHLLFGVNYGSFRLGTLNSAMARKIQELQLSGKIYRLTIAEVVKEKYMPPTAIIVELECENDFLADVA
ncbi:MAG: hypothetical protein H6603_03330 [Flavobacteriales bacterium]|nr:hypothetical protein [Flavobacteriales bacterium]MCB9203989.1 hypothetical protein [Flavobacteriales bacterium]